MECCKVKPDSLQSDLPAMDNCSKCILKEAHLQQLEADLATGRAAFETELAELRGALSQRDAQILALQAALSKAILHQEPQVSAFSCSSTLRRTCFVLCNFFYCCPVHCEEGGDALGLQAIELLKSAWPALVTSAKRSCRTGR